MNKTTMSDILEKIASASTDELNEIVEMVQIRRQHLVHKAKVGLRIGDFVRFTITGKRHTRLNGTWEGKIVRVMTKNIKVSAKHTSNPNVNVTTWTVPAPMIKKV